MIATTNYTEGGTQTETYKVLRCSPSFLVGLQQQQSISFTAVNIFLSITAFLGNSLILVALSKETSLHPPSKLMYRCLATDNDRKIQEGSDQCTNRKTYSSHLVVIGGITNILTYFNSTLNPFLYCWKVREVRQAVKQTIRRALYFPWT